MRGIGITYIQGDSSVKNQTFLNENNPFSTVNYPADNFPEWIKIKSWTNSYLFNFIYWEDDRFVSMGWEGMGGNGDLKNVVINIKLTKYIINIGRY